jgi:hypothetical protein
MCVLLLVFRYNEGTNVEEYNGYVVFKWNIYGSAGKWCGVEKCYFTHPHPLPQQASGQIFKRIEKELKRFDKIGTFIGFCTLKISHWWAGLIAIFHAVKVKTLYEK